MTNNEPENKGDFLQNLKKENAFQVPEKYFDEFPLKIRNRIDSETEKNWFENIFRLLKPQLKLAGGFIVLFLLAFSLFYIINNGKDNKKNTGIAETMDELDEISVYGINDDAEIIELLTSEENIGSEEAGSEEIMEYLLDYESDYLAYVDEIETE